ncbi:MAG: o-succinylbenzoate synthase, partial [Micrococcales bacterium]|nr:o-succinylbenzoate synthase [Micrococcales bacterium]
MTPLLTLHAYSLPLALPFRGITTREGVLVHGSAGWGEFSPFLDYPDNTTGPWWDAAVEAATLPFPAPLRDAIPVNVTIPAVEPELAAAIVRKSGGCGTAKVKVAGPGDTVESEASRLAAVRGALGASGAIRIDANGAWDLETAADRLLRLDRAAGGLEYAEQPCSDTADLARLRRRTPVPIAADESIRGARDPLEVARLEAADIVVMKVQPLGGVRACLALAEEIGLPVVVSSALETSVGMAAGLALAAALPTLPFACGLATAALLGADAVASPLVPGVGAAPGFLPVGRVTPDNLPAIAADDETTSRWEARVAG